MRRDKELGPARVAVIVVVFVAVQTAWVALAFLWPPALLLGWPILLLRKQKPSTPIGIVKWVAAALFMGALGPIAWVDLAALNSGE